MPALTNKAHPATLINVNDGDGTYSFEKSFAMTRKTEILIKQHSDHSLVQFQVDKAIVSSQMKVRIRSTAELSTLLMVSSFQAPNMPNTVHH